MARSPCCASAPCAVSLRGGYVRAPARRKAELPLPFHRGDLMAMIRRTICEWLMTSWPRALAMGLLLSLPAVGQAGPIPYAFSRIVDTSEPIPGGVGNFMNFAFAALDGETEAFMGFGA